MIVIQPIIMLETQKRDAANATSLFYTIGLLQLKSGRHIRSLRKILNQIGILVLS